MEPHLCYSNRELCDKLIRWDFRTSDIAHLFWMSVNAEPPIIKLFGKATYHEECLTLIQNLLLVFYGEAWRDCLQPLILRIKDGNLSNLVNHNSTEDMHLMLVDFVQQAFSLMGIFYAKVNKYQT